MSCSSASCTVAIAQSNNKSVIYMFKTTTTNLLSEVQTLQANFSDLLTLMIFADQSQILNVSAGVYSLGQCHSLLLRVQFCQKGFYSKKKKKKLKGRMTGERHGSSSFHKGCFLTSRIILSFSLPQFDNRRVPRHRNHPSTSDICLPKELWRQLL